MYKEQYSKSSLKIKFLIIAFILFIYLILHFLWNEYQFYHLSPIKKLNYLVVHDIELLEKSHYLPFGWHNLKEIEIVGGDKQSKLWIQNGFVLPLTPDKKGHYRLEVLLLSFTENKKTNAIIQYNLINLINKNMEWELGRTFNLQSEFISY